MVVKRRRARFWTLIASIMLALSTPFLAPLPASASHVYFCGHSDKPPFLHNGHYDQYLYLSHHNNTLGAHYHRWTRYPHGGYFDQYCGFGHQ